MAAIPEGRQKRAKGIPACAVGKQPPAHNSAADIAADELAAATTAGSAGEEPERKRARAVADSGATDAAGETVEDPSAAESTAAAGDEMSGTTESTATTAQCRRLAYALFGRQPTTEHDDAQQQTSSRRARWHMSRAGIDPGTARAAKSGAAVEDANHIAAAGTTSNDLDV